MNNFIELNCIKASKLGRVENPKMADEESVMMDLSHCVLLKHGGISMNPPLTVVLKLLESYRVKRCSYQYDFSSVCAASCQLSLSSVTIRPRPSGAGSSHGPDGGSSFSGTAH